MGPNNITIKANSEMTGGTFFLSETSLAARSPGPPPHTHDTITDMFYVLEGDAHRVAGRRRARGWFRDIRLRASGRGSHLPHELPDLPVRFLNANTPGGFESYMRELSASAADGPMTSEQIGAIAARYDFTAVVR